MKKGLLTLLLLATGCASTAIDSVTIAYDKAEREKYRSAAIKGDKVAQWNLGQAYCCAQTGTGSAYDTKLAIDWLCRSAQQNYAPAMYELGKLYSSDAIDNLRILKRSQTGAMKSIENLPLSFVWLKAASYSGSDAAENRMRVVWREMNHTLKDDATMIERKSRLRAASIPCVP